MTTLIKDQPHFCACAIYAYPIVSVCDQQCQICIDYKQLKKSDNMGNLSKDEANTMAQKKQMGNDYLYELERDAKLKENKCDRPTLNSALELLQEKNYALRRLKDLGREMYSKLERKPMCEELLKPPMPVEKESLVDLFVSLARDMQDNINEIEDSLRFAINTIE